MPHYDEDALCEQFLKEKIIRLKVEHEGALLKITSILGEIVRSKVGVHRALPLDNVHQSIRPSTLNEFRLSVINALNGESWFKDAYMSLGKEALSIIVGNEMAMQRKINISIQLPRDNSSLLPVHCDTWSGDSPYEVVLWVPFVNCFGTKSMFYCKADADARMQPRIGNYENSEKLYQAIEPYTDFIECNYGEMLIFTQNVMHGNRVNEEKQTRWSANCRFKGLLTPYADKKLGEFFEPVNVRPATRLGLEYELPKV
jgi:sporadic carbohydrate cluster 2OG-Fe(II) oxygenase